jgi:signal peptidase II
MLSLRALTWYGLALLIIGLDQWTKSIALASLQYNLPIEWFSWFDWRLQFNYGAAFSFLGDADGWQRYFFSAIALCVSVVLVIWIAKLQRQQWLLALSLALILGGAIGNVWDRILLGYVVDFISVHYQYRYVFPTFNVADSAISIGAVLMLLDGFIFNPTVANVTEAT